MLREAFEHVGEVEAGPVVGLDLVEGGAIPHLVTLITDITNASKLGLL